MGEKGWRVGGGGGGGGLRDNVSWALGSFTHWPAARRLLCSQVPNSHRPVLVLGLGIEGPWFRWRFPKWLPRASSSLGSIPSGSSQINASKLVSRSPSPLARVFSNLCLCTGVSVDAVCVQSPWEQLFLFVCYHSVVFLDIFLVSSFFKNFIHLLTVLGLPSLLCVGFR